MIWQNAFYIGGLILLLIMVYVLWSGVGRKRPSLGRGFAVIGMGLAGYIVYLALG